MSGDRHGRAHAGWLHARFGLKHASWLVKPGMNVRLQMDDSSFPSSFSGMSAGAAMAGRPPSRAYGYACGIAVAQASIYWCCM